MKAYDEFIDFIASGTSPETLLLFKPSAESQERVRELVQREKTKSSRLRSGRNLTITCNSNT